MKLLLIPLAVALYNIYCGVADHEPFVPDKYQDFAAVIRVGASVLIFAWVFVMLRRRHRRINAQAAAMDAETRKRGRTMFSDWDGTK